MPYADANRGGAREPSRISVQQALSGRPRCLPIPGPHSPRIYSYGVAYRTWVTWTRLLLREKRFVVP